MTGSFGDARKPTRSGFVYKAAALRIQLDVLKRFANRPSDRLGNTAVQEGQELEGLADMMTVTMTQRIVAGADQEEILHYIAMLRGISEIHTYLRTAVHMSEMIQEINAEISGFIDKLRAKEDE